MTPSKINLSSIMSNNKDNKKKIKKEDIIKENNIVKTVEKIKITPLNNDKIKVEKDTVNDEIKVEKDTVNDKTENGLQLKKIIKKDCNADLVKNEKHTKTEIFLNYKSDFIKKEEKIIKKIIGNKEKLKIKLREPKTRFILMGGLISLTLIIISGLFLLNPEKYSLNSYKTSILNNINNVKKSYIDKPWVDSVININDYNFSVKIQEKRNNNKNYKYNNIIFTTKDELYIVLNKEVELSNKKLKEEEKKQLEQEKIRLKEEKKKNEKTIITNILLEKFK